MEPIRKKDRIGAKEAAVIYTSRHERSQASDRSVAVGQIIGETVTRLG